MRSSSWGSQPAPEATMTLPGGWALTCCTRGAATLRERSYFDSKAPNALAAVWSGLGLAFRYLLLIRMFRLDMALPIVLARCKPLSDPVKSFARAVGVGMLICLLGGANQLLFLLILFGKSLPAGGMIILTWAILLSFLISLPLGMWLLLRTRKRTPVIYLRAFRSDRSARRLRSLLKAALGSQFRLSGIRQPRKRSTLFIRLFTQALTALKYVGSEHFELEAEDHNWMARLLASYASTRFFFIALPDV